MADLRNSMELMRRNLLRMGVLQKLTLKPKDLQQPTLRSKNPQLFLQLTNYLIIEYSTSLYRQVLQLVPNIKLVNDKKFLQSCYLVMRDILQCYPVITVDQFLTNKFLDLKLQFVTELAKNVYEWDMNVRNKRGVKKGKELGFQQKIVRQEEEEEEEEEEEREEPKRLVVAPTRLGREEREGDRAGGITESRTLNQQKPRILREVRQQEERIQEPSSYHQSEIKEMYELIGQVSATVNQLSSKFNTFQSNVVGWVNNINAKMSILQQKVKIIQNNL